MKVRKGGGKGTEQNWRGGGGGRYWYDDCRGWTRGGTGREGNARDRVACEALRKAGG